MSKLPTYEHGSFSRYKNDDGTTSCYRDGKFLGAFDNNSAFCDLFASLAAEIEKLKAELEAERAVVDYYASTWSWNDCGNSDIDHSVINEEDLDVPDDLCDRRGGKLARERQAKRKVEA